MTGDHPPPPAAPAGVTLRPIGPDDQELLFQIYASTRVEELAQVAWTDEQKQAFLRMQFAAQARDYTASYRGAEFLVILVDGEAAGRLYVHETEPHVSIIDIALLPAHRGRGLGGSLVRDIQAKAARQGKPLRIHVERYNPALRLYERLGFRPIADAGVYLLLQWRADGEAAGSAAPAT